MEVSSYVKSYDVKQSYNKLADGNFSFTFSRYKGYGLSRQDNENQAENSKTGMKTDGRDNADTDINTIGRQDKAEYDNPGSANSQKEHELSSDNKVKGESENSYERIRPEELVNIHRSKENETVTDLKKESPVKNGESSKKYL